MHERHFTECGASAGAPHWWPGHLRTGSSTSTCHTLRCGSAANRASLSIVSLLRSHGRLPERSVHGAASLLQLHAVRARSVQQALLRLLCGVFRHQCVLSDTQVAIRTMIAATAAAGLMFAPAPAMAGDVFTYGRSEVIAAKEKLLEEAQAKAVAAMEELAAAKSKVSSTVNNTVAQVGLWSRDRPPARWLDLSK